MFRFLAKRQFTVYLDLLEDMPRSTATFRMPTRDEWVRQEAVQRRARFSRVEVTGDAKDPELEVEQSRLEREFVLDHIVCLRNIHEPGDEIREREAIVKILEVMPPRQFATLIKCLGGEAELTVFEVKASASPSEEGPSTEGPATTRPSAHTTAEGAEASA